MSLSIEGFNGNAPTFPTFLHACIPVSAHLSRAKGDQSQCPIATRIETRNAGRLQPNY